MRASAPPPASALVPVGESTTLDAALGLLEEELTGLIDDGLGSDAGDAHLVRAEAISDRLLETELPFARVAPTEYSVEALLRQIQTLADRLVAQRQVARQYVADVGREEVLDDARLMLARVRDLRESLARGGTAEPVPLSRLLSGDTAPEGSILPPNPATGAAGGGAAIPPGAPPGG